MSNICDAANFYEEKSLRISVKFQCEYKTLFVAPLIINQHVIKKSPCLYSIETNAGTKNPASSSAQSLFEENRVKSKFILSRDSHV